MYNLIGGDSKYYNAFNKTAKLYITAYIGGETKRRIYKRYKIFLENNNLPFQQFSYPPHITLLQFDINIDSLKFWTLNYFYLYNHELV